MSKLRLGPLPKNEVARLTIALPAQVRADLDRYAELYAATYGESVEVGALAAQMISAFMERDRGFRSARQPPRTASDGNPSPLSMTDAVSSANATPSDSSSSR